MGRDMDLYHALVRYERDEGPASLILDLTGVTHVDFPQPVEA
jgi:hypothetical protein